MIYRWNRQTGHWEHLVHSSADQPAATPLDDIFPQEVWHCIDGPEAEKFDSLTLLRPAASSPALAPGELLRPLLNSDS